MEPPSFDDLDADVDIDPAGGFRQVGRSPLSLGRVKPVRVPEDRPVVVPAVDPPGRVRFTNVKRDGLANAGNVGAEGFVFQLGRADGLQAGGQIAATVDLSPWGGSFWA